MRSTGKMKSTKGSKTGREQGNKSAAMRALIFTPEDTKKKRVEASKPIQRASKATHPLRRNPHISCDTCDTSINIH